MLTVQSSKLNGRRAWLACAWLALPALAGAEGLAPNPYALGIAESAVNYCGPIDAAAAGKVRKTIEQLVQGASEQQLVEVRKSDEYRKAYESVVDFVGKVDPHNAKKFCSETFVKRD